MKEFVEVGFDDIVTVKNVYKAWKDFSTGKRDKQDVQVFDAHLEDELVALQHTLAQRDYIHGAYERFVVHEPKRRVIHKATVRDRVVHRLLYNALLPGFHRRWLDCSFSCRPGFGQHKSIEAVRKALRQATQNGSRECWVLKVDVRRFFDSVDHEVLNALFDRRVHDLDMRKLLQQVVGSFSTTQGCGLPIGNLTSQLFANVYLHELDWKVKHAWKCKWYFRYADDMLFLCGSREEAMAWLDVVGRFLETRLRLVLHPNKIIFRKSSWGIDWLGHVILPGHEVLRPSTRRRMMRKTASMQIPCDRRASLASYHGLLQGTARRVIDEELLQFAALDRVSCRDMMPLAGY